ncbi:MAG: hypothetical protein ACRDSR_09330 [Pseudonocardiaceae bacterium]
MELVTLDVVLLMPEILRGRAVKCSELLSERMQVSGPGSCFRLGKPFPGDGAGLCEPHVSLFMLSVSEAETTEVTNVVERLAETLSPLHAYGAEYLHNPQGALELHFTRSVAWRALQRAVVAVVEPLRRGRLRDIDPSGAGILELLDDTSQDDSRRRQLRRYGYDEIADESYGGHDRFSPHVTLAWPRDPLFRVTAEGLPSAEAFSGLLTELAVFGMSPYGTCTKNYGTFSLGPVPAPPVRRASRASDAGPLAGSGSAHRSRTGAC